MRFWLGWQDSNLRMTGSKPAALPLGYTPMRSLFLSKGPIKLKPFLKKCINGNGRRFYRVTGQARTHQSG